MSEVTQLLVALGQGDKCAMEALLPLVYDELRRLARAQMASERTGHTLDATALVHEAYLRLFGTSKPGWQGRAHFFCAAAESMRRILIDHARARAARKRGGEFDRVDFDECLPQTPRFADIDELLALDEALEQLAQCDPPRAELVKLLYYAGLSLGEAAEVQGISRTTAYRHWQFARAWLHNAINGQAAME